MSLARLYAKKDAEATQRRRLHASERLERDRRQAHPLLFGLASGLLPVLQDARNWSIVAAHPGGDRTMQTNAMKQAR
jgi:hypothetical protein